MYLFIAYLIIQRMRQFIKLKGMKPRVNVIGVENMGQKLKPKLSILKHISYASIKLSANFVLSFLAAKVKREMSQGKIYSSHKRNTETREEFLPWILEKRIWDGTVEEILDKIPINYA